MKTLVSKVKGFKGECLPTWINTSEIDRRFTNCAKIRGCYTGYFKLVKNFLWFKIKVGEEFHGYIKNGKVYSTKNLY